MMKKIARAGRLSPRVRSAVIEITAGLPQKDYLSEISAIHRFVRDRVRYFKDPVALELLQTPDVTLQLLAGDCDDKSILTASMLAAAGVKSRFVAVGNRPGVYSHVYVEFPMGAKWIPLETTEPWDMGMGPTRYAARMVRDIF